jgi:hypothetical protein
VVRSIHAQRLSLEGIGERAANLNEVQAVHEYMKCTCNNRIGWRPTGVAMCSPCIGGAMQRQSAKHNRPKGLQS